MAFKQQPQKDRLFVFDIETVPDVEVVPNLIAPGDPEYYDAALETYHLNLTDGKSAFPRLPFHKVVAISFLEAKITRDNYGEYYEIVDLRTGGTEESTEKELLQGFHQHLAKIQPRLVSYNGRGFDLPVLKYRAMKHNVAARWLYKSGDKWNSYNSRYSDDWHCDLNDVLRDYGSSGPIKLNEICATLGLPGKCGTDGSQVAELYEKGQIQEIRNYCETDVLNTYLVYLNHMYHRGEITLASFNQSIHDVETILKNSEQPHLQDFLTQWKEAKNNQS